jgi:hypothetical protein
MKLDRKVVSLEGSVGEILHPENIYNNSYIRNMPVLKPVLNKMENKKMETVHIFSVL